MKKLIIAAVAATFAFAVHAAAPAAADKAAAQKTAAAAAPMAAEQCTSQWNACKDEECRNNLKEQGCDRSKQ